jgi:NTP pyrophosphatase (non-canonical NTP hydrolase)
MSENQTKHSMSYSHELLQLLQEECAEVIQASSKCIRFGEKDNSIHLEKELGDLFCILSLMHENDMFSYTKIDQYIEEKREKLERYSNLFK